MVNPFIYGLSNAVLRRDLSQLVERWVYKNSWQDAAGNGLRRRRDSNADGSHCGNMAVGRSTCQGCQISRTQAEILDRSMHEFPCSSSTQERGDCSARVVEMKGHEAPKFISLTETAC
ncbi:uncharacterized protein LOC125178414 [Hyalella azteca]|uniref:Uncharacterized protein LOC125178414 n=1 Tax=Hyalella azteca TaxID=294128 RepID=A0A979FLY1_HYAAZ|nr:uncharacterized protein LOC125178414 [Hyalella azteca]